MNYDICTRCGDITCNMESVAQICERCRYELQAMESQYEDDYEDYENDKDRSRTRPGWITRKVRGTIARARYVYSKWKRPGEEIPF